MSKLVLIDGNAILHRAYHALPALTTRTGEPINAVYGLVSMLLRVIQDLKPSHIAVCFDRKEPTFRHKEFKQYQAQRPTMDIELSSQFEKAKATVDAFGIPIYEKAGYEADDLLATITSQVTVDEVIIVTGDRDILQLVDDKRKVKVYLPAKGLSEAKLMESSDVVEKLGVKPEQIPDYKALVGDASDNYKGVPGIGPKTAVNLIKEYGSVKNVFNNLNSLPLPIKDKLVKNKKSADLSYKLATILREVPIEVDFEKMDNWIVDSPNVLNLFKDFGFKTLSKRVKEVGKQVVSENQASLF